MGVRELAKEASIHELFPLSMSLQVPDSIYREEGKEDRQESGREGEVVLSFLWPFPQ